MIIQHFYGDSIFFNKDPEFINFEYKTSQDWEKIIVSFKILGVYPGNKYDDVSISQLIFNSEYGADFDE